MKKVIFITGPSTGFGRLSAITLSNAGYTVIAGMREVKGKNAAPARELSALPGVEVIEIDVTSDHSVKDAFTSVLSKYGTIDVLVNNAGALGFGLLEAFSVEQVKKLFEVNFYGVIRTYQEVLPVMRKAGKGLIINITSGASGHTLPFMIPYMASKFGVEAISEGLQDELSEYNIENVTIQPGVYPTEMTDGSKAGIHSDREKITADYGQSATDKFNALGAGLYGKMAQYDMNPQVIANGILELIAMEDGSRPVRFPLDAIAEGTDKEFIEARAANKAKWLAKYTS